MMFYDNSSHTHIIWSWNCSEWSWFHQKYSFNYLQHFGGTRQSHPLHAKAPSALLITCAGLLASATRPAPSTIRPNGRCIIHVSAVREPWSSFHPHDTQHTHSEQLSRGPSWSCLLAAPCNHRRLTFARDYYARLGKRMCYVKTETWLTVISIYEQRDTLFTGGWMILLR